MSRQQTLEPLHVLFTEPVWQAAHGGLGLGAWAAGPQHTVKLASTLAGLSESPPGYGLDGSGEGASRSSCHCCKSGGGGGGKGGSGGGGDGDGKG